MQALSVAKSEEQVAALKLFNEKVKELLELSFVKAVTAPNAGVVLSAQRQEDGSFEFRSAVRGPSIEAIKAFVLTFRFFIQDNEAISLRNIASLYDGGNINPQQTAYFKSARDAVNQMLDSPNFMHLSFNNVTPTNREVMEVFVYGGLAHANPQKYERFKEWMSVPPAAALLQGCFNKILGSILRALVYIAQVNETTIQQLTGENHE
jgi:hypothetical protein